MSVQSYTPAARKLLRTMTAHSAMAVLIYATLFRSTKGPKTRRIPKTKLFTPEQMRAYRQFKRRQRAKGKGR